MRTSVYKQLGRNDRKAIQFLRKAGYLTVTGTEPKAPEAYRPLKPYSAANAQPAEKK